MPLPDLRPEAPPLVVVMGVSGCGKSTLGAALAQALGVRFEEGDDHHPPENIRRMAAGIALTDADRAGWLDTLAGLIGQAAREGRGLVLSCSALRRSYRERLRGASGAGPALRFIHLHGDAATLAQRVRQRSGHYMPPGLLDSQLATLEMPAADEAVLALDLRSAPEELVRQSLRALAGPALASG